MLQMFEKHLVKLRFHFLRNFDSNFFHHCLRTLQLHRIFYHFLHLTPALLIVVISCFFTALSCSPLTCWLDSIDSSLGEFLRSVPCFSSSLRHNEQQQYVKQAHELFKIFLSPLNISSYLLPFTFPTQKNYFRSNSLLAWELKNK